MLAYKKKPPPPPPPGAGGHREVNACLQKKKSFKRVCTLKVW